jgi:hypothetical protein
MIRHTPCADILHLSVFVSNRKGGTLSTDEIDDNPANRGGNASMHLSIQFSGAGTSMRDEPQFGHAKRIVIDSGMQQLSMVLDGPQIVQLVQTLVIAYAGLNGVKRSVELCQMVRADLLDSRHFGKFQK